MATGSAYTTSEMIPVVDSESVVHGKWKVLCVTGKNWGAGHDGVLRCVSDNTKTRDKYVLGHVYATQGVILAKQYTLVAIFLSLCIVLRRSG